MRKANEIGAMIGLGRNRRQEAADEMKRSPDEKKTERNFHAERHHDANRYADWTLYNFSDAGYYPATKFWKSGD